MPQRDGRPYEAFSAPPALPLSARVWVCRYSGGLYATYEEYLRALASFRQRVWGCKHTGASNLSYEEALASEAKVQSILDQFPDCYEEAVIKLVHYATLKEEELSQRVVSYFQDRFVAGEVVLGSREGGKQAPCTVVAALDPACSSHDSQAMSLAEAIPPPDPDDEYRVEWKDGGGVCVMKRRDLTRQKVPLSKAVFKSWLRLAADEQHVTGLKGIPCMWVANERMTSRFGLPREVPASLTQRMERIQQEKEQSRKSRYEDEFVREEEEPAMANDDQDFEEEMETPSGRAAAGLRGRVSSRGGPSSVSTYEAAEDQQQGPAKVVVPVETLEQVRARLEDGSVKRAIVDALERAGPEGLPIASLVEAVQVSGVKSWDGARSANSSVSATCSHDLAFLRLAPGHFTLRVFKHETMEVPATAAAAGAGEGEPGVRSPQVERNNFKCPRCHKAHHPQNSPLVLCDSCPRSYHLECLGLQYEQLPLDEWSCPKCEDRKAGRRGPGGSGRNHASERADAVEAEERHGGRGGRRKSDERGGKEKRVDDRFMRVQARFAAKWAALHPPDDLQTLEDEEDNLAAAEAEWHTASEEAARAARKAEEKGEQRAMDRAVRMQRKAQQAGHRVEALKLVVGGPQPVANGVTSDASRCALYDALAIVDFITIFGASFEAAPLSLLEVQQMAAYPLDTDHLAQFYIALLRCLLIEAMGTEGVAKSRAKRWGRVIDEATWPEVLRRYLLASRAGVAVPADLETMHADSDAAGMDDNVACIVAAHLLSQMPYHRLSCGLHLRLLVALCNDVSDCTTLRNEISARIEEMLKIQAQFRQQLLEDRKRQKVEILKPVQPKVEKAESAADAAEGAGEDVKSQTGGDTLAEGGPPDGPAANGAVDEEPELSTESDEARPGKEEEEVKTEGNEGEREQADGQEEGSKVDSKPEEGISEAVDPGLPESEPPEDPKEGKGTKRGRKELSGAKGKGPLNLQQKGKRRKRQKVSGKKVAQAPLLPAMLASVPGKDYEEELREREAALDDAMDARAIRGEALGQDRHFRRYWWYPGEQSAIFIEEPDSSCIGVLESPDEVNALMERLNQNGLREKALYDTLAKRHDHIAGSLGYHLVNLDIYQAPRPFPDKDIEREAGLLDKAAVQASLGKMRAFLEQLDAVPAAPAGSSVEEWGARLEGVRSSGQLAAALLDLEASINHLGSGLPSGANNAALAGYNTPGKLKTAGSEDVAAQAPSDDGHPGIEGEGRGSPESDPAEPGFSRREASVPDPPNKSGLAGDGNPAAREGAQQASAASAPSIPNGHLPSAPHRDTHPASAPSTGQPEAATRTAEASCTPSGRHGPEDGSTATPPCNGNGAIEPSIGPLPAALLPPDEKDPGSLPIHRLEGKGELEAECMEDAREGDGAGAGEQATEPPERHPTSLGPVEFVGQLFSEADYSLPAGSIQAPDELDASDTENSKNRRGGTLWRSARERKAWLKDARRALHSQDASCCAYVASVLVDRAQPLLRSLQRAYKRAEKELAEFGATVPTDEGTPAPQTDRTMGVAEAGRAGSLGKGRQSWVGDAAGGSGDQRGTMPPPAQRPRTAGSQDSPEESQEPEVKGEDGRWSLDCQVCGGQGDLLGCDAPECTAAEHIACAGLDERPEGEWYCTSHRNKPSVKRKRSSSARKSAEPQAIPHNTGGLSAPRSRLASPANGVVTGPRSSTKRRRR